MPRIIPLVAIRMNDCTDGADLHCLPMHGLPAAQSGFPDVDCALVPAACGVDTQMSRALGALRAAVPLPPGAQGPMLLDGELLANVSATSTGEFHGCEKRKH